MPILPALMIILHETTILRRWKNDELIVIAIPALVTMKIIGLSTTSWYNFSQVRLAKILLEDTKRLEMENKHGET